MITAIGHSKNPVTSQALEEVILQCRDSIGDIAPDIGILFTSRMDADFQSILARTIEEWPGIQLAGCTTDGEISHVFPCTEDSISLLLINSRRISFSMGLGENLSRNPVQAVSQAYDQAKGSLAGEPVLALVLADGVTTFGISLDKALLEVLGKDLPVFGGNAGDHFNLEKTFQFYNRRVVSDSLILILLSGPALFSMRLMSGWKPIGKVFQVKKIRGNVIWEIDNVRAVDFFRRYLGPNQKEYVLFPLAVMIGEDDYVLRDPVNINEEDGSVSFVGSFPKNPSVRLTEFSREGLLAASGWACKESLETFPGISPELALVFPCTSRRHILGTMAAQEHNPLMAYRRANPLTSFFGMYVYGEIGPMGATSETVFQNTTYALLLLGEKS